MTVLASRILTPLIGAALLLTGCTPAPGTASGSPSSTALTEKDSPLVKYLSSVLPRGLAPNASPQEQQQYQREREERRQQVIAACMKEQGFEYVPFVDVGAPADPGSDPWRPEDRDWVEKYGYGLTQSPYLELPQPETTAAVDPNEAYVETLTDAERRAYDEARNGKPDVAPEGESDGGAPEWRWQDAGCFGRAAHEVDGDDPWQQPENQQLVAAFRKFFDQRQSLPGLAELDARWAACMAEAGQTGFAKQSDAQDSISTLTDRYWEQRSDDSDDRGTMKDPDWEALADQEVSLALIDLTCREQVDYRQQQLRIQFAAEEQFLTDHAEELAALKSRLEQLGS